MGNILAQALPIAIDGRFDDWPASLANYEDKIGDGADIDLLSFSVSNDSSYLFIKFEMANELLLNSNNELFLEIDTDNDSTTGININGIGADLEWNFAKMYGKYYAANGFDTVRQSNISLLGLPTVSSNVYELAIRRNIKPVGKNSLFKNNNIKICFVDKKLNGDFMPDLGEKYSYSFDSSPVPLYKVVDLEKQNAQFIRVMTYNTLWGGIVDTLRQNAFKRIIIAVNPDIITFNECWKVKSSEVKNLLNKWLPLNDNKSWNCIKVDSANITCSKFHVKQTWRINKKFRMTASLINLPEIYKQDILAINCHFVCCQNNERRQAEADAFINFIIDLKTKGGVIDLPYGTPFFMSGDLNLVTYSQQLKTLLTGNIIDTETFGEPQKPDWNDKDLLDVISLHTDQRMAYTWRDSKLPFCPGRLDYTICSQVNMTVEKAFTLETNSMSNERLRKYGLFKTDTHVASDHLPKVTDFSIPVFKK
ncbi:MAG: hypothetical protein DRJ01_03320 [Bacteroidetes bacterium]|nr:MAG: hypothetical protein DRJ01_03320 [Bacteroidota bacterium]